MRLNKLTRWTGILLATVLLALTAVLSMVYTPFTQRAITQWGASRLSHQTGMKVEIQEVHLRFPLRIKAEGVHIGQMAEFKHLSTAIRLRPLLRGVVKADYVSLQGITIRPDTATGTNIQAQHLRADGLSYDWHRCHAHLQHLYLVSGHATLHKHTAPKEHRIPLERLPLSLTISSIKLSHVGASYCDTAAQLQGRAEAITIQGVQADTAINLSLQVANISEGELIFQSSRFATHCSQLNLQTESLRYNPTTLEGELTQLSVNESHGMNIHQGMCSFVWREGMLRLSHLALHTAHSSLDGSIHLYDRSAGNTTIDCHANLRIGPTDALLLAHLLANAPDEFVHLYPTEALTASVSIKGTTNHLRLTHCDISLPSSFDINIRGVVQDITQPSRRAVQCHIEANTHDITFLTSLMRERSIHIPTEMSFQADASYAPDTLHALCRLTLEEGSATLEMGYRPISQAYRLQLQTDSLNVLQFMPDGKCGLVSMQALLEGSGLVYKQSDASAHAMLQLHHLQWGATTIANATAQVIHSDKQWYAHASCNDSLMQWHLNAAIRADADTIRTKFHVQIADLNLRDLQLADTDIHPALQCHATLDFKSGDYYALRSTFCDITLHTPTRSIRAQSLDLRGALTTDSILLGIHSGDLTLTASARTEGFPWLWEHPLDTPHHLTHLQAILSAGEDNPISNYLSLMGITFRDIHATITGTPNAITSILGIRDITAKGIEAESLSISTHYTDGTLRADVQSGELSLSTPLLQLRGKASAILTCNGPLTPDNISGELRLSSVQLALPTYNIQLHTIDTLSIPLGQGTLVLYSLPIYTINDKPLLLDGEVTLFSNTPKVRLTMTAHNADILQGKPTHATQLYGRAIISGSVMLEGALSTLSITGDLQLLAGSSLHFLYKEATLISGDQLDNVVTFVSPHTDSITHPRGKPRANAPSIRLAITIAPTAELEVSLGANKQNSVVLQGGGVLTLQYASPMGLSLSGRYTIEQGTLSVNVPFLHVSTMTIRTGSTVTWEGNVLNPLLDITAEEHLRASVTLDGSPQSVLFVAGISLTDTMERLNVQFTLAAPENASMQNTLATLSPDERGKLSVALLTTGLYLGEGGAGKLMNTALMGILQAQLDNLSRDAFRTVDVSVGIEPLLDGVSGVSTRTDYSFSIAKRLWDNRIRIIIGGSVTTSNERIEDDAIIDNISIEWRLSPIGNQYLRFFYDKHFESILEGEIRETGLGYAYRRRF